MTSDEFQSMAEAEVDLFDVLQSAPVGALILDDRDNQVLFWNHSVLGILGDLHGESFAQAASHGFFHDAHDFQVARAQLAATGSVRNQETRMWRALGNVCWANVTMEPIRFENNPATLIWYFDITDSKRREHRLERSQDALLEVLDAAPTGAALTDGPERICYWNNALLDIFPGTGGDPSEAIRTGVTLAHAAIAENGQGTTFCLPMPDGEERSVAAWKFAVEFESAPAELIWLHDVTVLRRAERTAQAATAAKSAFLATMSHEIRTPMNGVIAIADLLAETELNPDQASMIRIVQQSAESLIRVINDILDFSKLESSQLHVENIPFRLDDVLDGVTQLLEPKAAENGLALNTRLRGLDDAARVGDPLRLRQVLLNLLGNAIKFTAKGSVTLDVDASKDQVIFRIVDTGIGIAAEKIERLFKPYQQADIATARNYGGTGLGLSISNALLALMGGSLRVESQLGRGSCFTITLALPRDDAALAGGATAGTGFGQDSGSGEASFWEPIDRKAAEDNVAVILCAEDNPVNRDVLVRVLNRLGLVFDMAEDGAQALAMLDRSRHGLLLTDGHMPAMDGWDMVRAVRAAEAVNGLARLPVFLATADAVSNLTSRAEPGDFDDYFTKPLRRDHLEAAILETLPVLAKLRVPRQGHATRARGGKGGVDLSILIELIGDAKDDLQGILNEFHLGAMAQYAKLVAALAADDRGKLAVIAHAMKGSAGYAGARCVAEHADAVEAAARSGATAADLKKHFDGLTLAMDALPAEIASSLARLP